MKKEIKRESLKNNFLKNIIVRFDYTGLAEVELDQIISEVKPIFEEAGYNRLKEEFLTELDFQLQDPENIELEGIPVKDIRKKRAQVFINDEKGIKCKLSTKFALVSIQNQSYISFHEYSKTLITLIQMLKEKVKFMRCFRFGIRKVNQCIIKDINKLNEYFEPEFFKIYGIDKGATSKLFESKDCFKLEQYNVNLTRLAIQGEYDGEVAYQIILDSDIYIADPEGIDELLANGDKIIMMNEWLFELYKEVLTIGFIKALGNNEFDDSNVIGVECNG